MRRLLAHGLMFLFLLLAAAGAADAACGDPGESPCSCGWLGLGKCCDYDYLALIGECSDSAGFPTFCGGTNEPACKIWQHTTACKSGRANVDGTCRRVDSDGYPTGCGGKDEPACSLVYQVALGISACKSGLTQIPAIGGTCRQLDADGFPSFCGGEGERPCTLVEHIPSCKDDLYEIPFPGGDCTRLDADGFPPFCGGSGERACNLNEHIPSCKSNLIEVEQTCDTLDSDGYPTLCGDVGEPACSLIVQAALGVTSCKPSTRDGFETAEIPFGAGTCYELDADGFPSWCGGEGERPCTIVEHIPSCKRYLEEDFLAGQCLDTFPAGCGRNGQRPCEIWENLLSCKLGLSERDFDFGECGANPASWDEAEVPRGGPRTVFLIHGRGGDFEDLARKRADGMSRLAHRLFFETPNVKQVYGVDWNAGGDAARKLTIRRYYADTSGSCTGEESDGKAVCEGGATPGASCSQDVDCHGATAAEEFGQVTFDRENFRVYEIARSLYEAIVELETEENITIITHSYGGVIGRHLVYRYYDDLRREDKRIAEAITLMAPHRGGGMATPEVPDGEFAQNTMACALDLANLGDEGLTRAEWHNVCELGGWHDFRKRREGGILGPPFGSHFIDDRDYPQIRWINVVDNGFPLEVIEGPTAGIDPGKYPEPLRTYVAAFKAALDLLVNLDSDGIVLTSSAWGIQADECYPYTRDPGPEGKPIEVAPLLRQNFETDENDDPVPGTERMVLSDQCHHPAARVDPRYAEREELRRNHDMNHEDIRDFVEAVLSLQGDNNGDGVIDASDQTVVAKAGPDFAIECEGELTDVTLDGTQSDDPAGGGLTFDWEGDFGTISGPLPTIGLPPGLDTISLFVEDALGRTDTDSVDVTVVDTTPPAIEAGDDVELEATSIDGASFTLSASATDSCGAASVAMSPEGPTFPLGTTAVTITATDDSGNETVVTRSVIVADTTPPEIVAPAGLIREATAVLSPVDPGQASTSDIFPVDVTHDAPHEGFALGTTRVTWTARDANGNESTATQDVTIEDTTPPVIDAPADVTAEATAIRTPVAIGTATTTDIFGVSVTNNAPADGFPYGETLVEWIATDTHENEARASQTVVVVDTTPPTLTVPADVVVPAAGPATPIDPGTASATDIFEPVDITSDAPSAFPPGITTVRWTAVDAHGNASTGTQQVQAVYGFGGFAPPLSDGGIYKANRTLPIRFALLYAGGEAVTGAVATLAVVPLGDDDTPGQALDVGAGEDADSGMTFRATDDGYHYNLSTAGMPAGRYRITVSIDDGTSHRMDVILR